MRVLVRYEMDRLGTSPAQINQSEHSLSEHKMLRFSFPADHALSVLRRMWDNEVGKGDWLTIPALSDLTNPVEIPQENLEQERLRMDIVLSHVGQARLSQVCPNGTDVTDQDEGVVVFSSQDESVAWLLLLPPTGKGRTLGVSQIHEIIQNNGIVYGVDWNLLCGMAAWERKYFCLIPIARSKPPVSGKDGRVEDLFPREVEEDVFIEDQDVEQMDCHMKDLVQSVEQGTVICRIHPPTPGIPGRTVMGKPIPALPGDHAVIPQGRNTQLSQDGKELVAQCAGHLEFAGQNFQVKRVWHIQEADMENRRRLNFLGDIHIHCDVPSGVSVCATGNIQIDGVLEACTLQAGENIILRSGVQGQNQAVVQAQKSVYAKYMESCQIYAQEDVFATCLINCQVYSNRSVYVRAGRGTLVGGVIQAACQVSAMVVGSKAECSTQIHLGGNPCRQAEREYIRQEIADMEKELAELENSPDGEKEGQKGKLRLNICVSRIKLDKLEKEMEAENKPYQGEDQCRLRSDVVYRGTVVSIGRSQLSINRELSRCVLALVNGEVSRL